MKNIHLSFFLAAVALAAVLIPFRGHADTYDDVDYGITFGYMITSDIPPYTATITDVSFYLDMDPEHQGSQYIPGQPIDPLDPDSEIYYPTYAYVQFPDSVPGLTWEGEARFTVTAIASHVLDSLCMGNGGEIDVYLPGGLKTVEDDAFALSYPDPSAPITVTVSTFPGSLEYFGYQSTPIYFGTEFDSQGVENLGGWVVGFDQSQAQSQGGPPTTRRQINLMNATGIVGGAFENNTYIQSVILPSTIKAIPTKAFAGCTSLGMGLVKGTVTIPASVELIGDYAFQGASHVTNFVFEGDAPQVGYNAFDGIGSFFLNLQNGELPTATVHSGTSGWGQEGEVWNGLRITYADAPTSYTITWLNDDNTLLAEEIWPVGSRPTHEDPTKYPTSQYTYTFSNWAPTIETVTSNATYTAGYTATLQSYLITWLDDDGTVLGTDMLAYGDTPSRQGPTKADVPPYSYAFAAWTPAIVPVTGDASYTATYTRIADLSTLTGDWTATNGDVLTNTTAHAVTVPGGATVTINGMTVTGGGGAASAPATFAEGGEAITSKIAPGSNGTWTLTAFAELASGSAEGLDDAQVKVYAADTLAGLATAVPMASGVVVTNKTPAVKVELEVTPPANADAQFFRVGFGE